jgi:DNA-binding transcriptional LysR family regulator
VKVEFLFEDDVVVVAGPQSRWASRRKIDLAELAAERWILGAPHTANYVDVTQAFRARGLAMPNVALESLSVPLRAYLLASCDFITAMPKIGRVPITGEDIACRFADSPLAVCNIHAEEPNSEPCGR